MSGTAQGPQSLSDVFDLASGRSLGPDVGGKADKTRPFSIRLTPAERASLEERAGRQPLGQYIRGILLAEQATPRRVARQPVADERQVAALLAGLGQSRLSSNMNQIAKAANMGTLEVDEQLRQELQHACAAIVAMRQALLIALRLNPRGASNP